jgi:hypothetical protein
MTDPSAELPELPELPEDDDDEEVVDLDLDLQELASLLYAATSQMEAELPALLTPDGDRIAELLVTLHNAATKIATSIAPEAPEFARSSMERAAAVLGQALGVALSGAIRPPGGDGGTIVGGFRL